MLPTPRELCWAKGQIRCFGLYLIECDDGLWATEESYGVGRWPEKGGVPWASIRRLIEVRQRGGRDE